MTVYGIDLGTCYSCIARDDGSGVMPVELISSNGRKFVPSVVTFDNRNFGKPIVGYHSKSFLKTRPECTMAFVKREMNREFCENEISIAGKMRKISPVEVSACILKHLFDGANIVETGSGRDPATHAVITIPAKFDEQQRARTKLAAQMAGIHVLGLLNEPTAAAIAYDIPAGSTVLVFDLGGGTLDVSIVTNNNGNYKVIGTPAGDDHLGGIEWDKKIIELAFQKVGRRSPAESNTAEWKKLMYKAEEIKQELSETPVVLDEENLIDDGDVEIERSEYEIMCQGLLNRCWEVVDKAIANAKAENPKLKIDFFLTVGGSSRMPMIRKGIISRYGSFYGKGKSEGDWLRIKNPDTAIAIGAAKYARMIENGIVKLEDKATHSYGLHILKDGEDIIKNLVKSTDPIAFHQQYEGLIMNEDADNISIAIFENDSIEDYAEYDESKLSKNKMLQQTVYFDSVKREGTPLTIGVNRDMDGLIKITVICGNNTQTLDIHPMDILIDATTKANIEHSLSLMK